MSKIRFTLKAFAFLVITLACASAAQAQATRTWVSGVGDDVNPCSRTAPCKTFAGAISKTAASGEIDCLDPGGFGTVTITKSLTIDGTTGAGFGSILAAGTNGVNVNDSATGSPNTIIVSLRNLSINGAGTGFDGIRFISGKVLNVETCIIQGFRGNGTSSDGIDVALTASVAGNQRLLVKDTDIRNNTGTGIRASNSGVSGFVNVTLENVRSSHNDKGVSASTGSRWIIADSSFNLNTNAGVDAAAGNIGVDLDHCLIHSNGTSGVALAASTLTISNVRFTNNSTAGIAMTGGTIVTFGDNKFTGTDITGGSIPAPTLKK
ncbi:MAG: hypothetical protein QOH49_1445 [Acidobacteriota bacterium]|jgi:hypothetical protein|nr:hypothetical protein [Acidobacteriota bacterium]